MSLDERKIVALSDQQAERFWRRLHAERKGRAMLLFDTAEAAVERLCRDSLPVGRSSQAD